MATLFIDGFDKYGPTGEASPSIFSLMTQGEWTNGGGAGGGISIGVNAGLSATGYSMRLSDSFMNKTLAANYSRLIGGFRFSVALNGTLGLVGFVDGTSNQCWIQINGNGTFSITTGQSGGTAIGTSTASVSTNTTHYLEWDITFGAAGAFTIYLDGVSIITGTGATKTTGNSYANALYLGTTNAGQSGSTTYDDLYLFDTTGSRNNAVLLTSPRIETRYPSSDTQTQWTNGGNVLVPTGIVQTGVSLTNFDNNPPGANELVLLKVKPAVACSLQSVGVFPNGTSITAKFKGVLYADSSGSPAALVATGTEFVGCSSGVSLALSFASGQSLVAGTSYWIGFITDTSVSLWQYDSSTNLGRKVANTYGSGAPGTAGAMSTNQPTWQIWGNATGAATNWESVACDPADGIGAAGDNSTIYSASIGQEDLYGFPALTTAASNIYVVAVKANAKRSDTGSRTLDLRLKSNTNGTNTDSAGSNAGQTPGTSYGWLDSYFETDPDTGTTWTATGANNAKAGVKIAS